MPETSVPPPVGPLKAVLAAGWNDWLEQRRQKVAKDADGTLWFYAIKWAMAVGLLGILIYSVMVLNDKETSFFGVLGCAVLIALAATLAGALAGFVFGIPKTVASGSTSTGATYQGNTNLEQISDWLTKILVGAGLVELRGIFNALKSFGSQFGKSKVLGQLGWIAAPALVIAYGVCGFLLAYLWARIYLTADLEQRATAAALAEASRSASPDSSNTLPVVPKPPPPPPQAEEKPPPPADPAPLPPDPAPPPPNPAPPSPDPAPPGGP